MGLGRCTGQRAKHLAFSHAVSQPARPCRSALLPGYPATGTRAHPRKVAFSEHQTIDIHATAGQLVWGVHPRGRAADNTRGQRGLGSGGGKVVQSGCQAFRLRSPAGARCACCPPSLATGYFSNLFNNICIKSKRKTKAKTASSNGPAVPHTPH